MLSERSCAQDAWHSETGRRAELRAFLVQRRSELTPEDVGLPQTGHRRVTGLRREEVAELAGVSNDWYRWLESGREIRVSIPFLARLADALLLSGDRRYTLYRLALPDLYNAHLTDDLRAKERLRLSRSWERRRLRCGRYAYTGS